MKELAEFLKNERLNCSLTVEALSERSGISVSMLESFESWDFERFGASILLRNIVRAYCEALHIESEPLLVQYASQIEACNVQEEGIKRYGRLQKTLYKRRRMVALPVLVLFLASAAVFYGGEWISKRRSTLYAPPNANRIFSQQNLPVELQELPASKEKPKVAKPTTPAPANPAPQTAGGAGKTDENQKPATVLSNQPPTSQNLPVGLPGLPPSSEKPKVAKPTTPAPANPAPQTAGEAGKTDENQKSDAQPGGATVLNNQPFTGGRFTVEAEGKVWIQVKIDGQKPRSELLHPGDHREWVAAKSLEVVVGNAGGVRMQWNDHPLEAPHKSGRVLRFRLPDYAKAAQG
ncbi:MAG: DUF4115 domain-containing protein [Syntrophobacteraceae bacterium]|nr:DUF4115 domain-containing protein [Syntrophobacteraceae bacterium]